MIAILVEAVYTYTLAFPGAPPTIPELLGGKSVEVHVHIRFVRNNLILVCEHRKARGRYFSNSWMRMIIMMILMMICAQPH